MQDFQGVGPISRLTKEFLQFNNTGTNSLFRFPPLPRSLSFFSALPSHSCFPMFRLHWDHTQDDQDGYAGRPEVPQSCSCVSFFRGWLMNALIVMVEEQMWKTLSWSVKPLHGSHLLTTCYFCLRRWTA